VTSAVIVTLVLLVSVMDLRETRAVVLGQNEL
jgi:hypothetical protein